MASTRYVPVRTGSDPVHTKYPVPVMRLTGTIPDVGPSKVPSPSLSPRPGVDLVNMAPPGREVRRDGSRASTIGTVTAALKSVLLSDAVLMWNSYQ